MLLNSKKIVSLVRNLVEKISRTKETYHKSYLLESLKVFIFFKSKKGKMLSRYLSANCSFQYSFIFPKCSSKSLISVMTVLLLSVMFWFKIFFTSTAKFVTCNGCTEQLQLIQFTTCSICSNNQHFQHLKHKITLNCNAMFEDSGRISVYGGYIILQ